MPSIIYIWAGMGGHCRRSKVSTSNIHFHSSLPAKTFNSFEVEHTLRNLGREAILQNNVCDRILSGLTASPWSPKFTLACARCMLRRACMLSFRPVAVVWLIRLFKTYLRGNMMVWQGSEDGLMQPWSATTIGLGSLS